MREPTRNERAAMWLYGEEYAGSRLSAVDFWKKLPENRKEMIRLMVQEIVDAKP